MLHIPNSVEENCLKENAKHTLCLKSDIKSIKLRITKPWWWETIPPLNAMTLFLEPLIFGLWRNAHYQYTNPLARPLMIALQVVRTLFRFHLRECMRNSFPSPWAKQRSRWQTKRIVGKSMGDILRTLESDNGDVHENIAEKQTPHPFKSNYFANIPSHPVSKKKGT